MVAKLSFAKNLAIGFTLFALFLGAGNVIFPPQLGQIAGDNLVIAMTGFIITGVGLPLLTIIAIAKAGGDLQALTGRVHPVFSIIFTTVVYLALGPLFGIPRTGTVTYEVGIMPLLPEAFANGPLPLALFTIVFFTITSILALNPHKLVDRIGKIMTPILLLVIALLAVKSVITPMGDLEPAQGNYINNAFPEGFIQGYLTLDVMGALIIGIFLTGIFHGIGVHDKQLIVKSTIFAGVVAAIGLSFVYISLSYIGATSTNAIGIQDNGGAILALSSKILYGQSGLYILAVTIIFACLTTAIGVVSATALYFNKLLPKISYKTFVVILSGFSAIVANVGLTKLIAISLPVLIMVYPLAIVLVILSLIDKLFGQASIVYSLSLIGTFIVSIFDGLRVLGIIFPIMEKVFSYLPFYDQGLAWIVPAVVAGLIGVMITMFSRKKEMNLEA